MAETAKKTVKKKSTAATKSLIKYADKRLRPSDGSMLHPIYYNNHDKMIVLPHSMFDLATGLEIAVPPSMILMSSMNVQGTIQIGGTFHGYQKDLKIKLWNMTDTVIEVDPYQKIGHIFMAEMKGWK